MFFNAMDPKQSAAMNPPGHRLKRVLRPFRPMVKWLKRTTRPGYLELRRRLGEEEYERVLKNAMSFASGCQVEGDYLEFGVAWGNTFLAAYHNAQRHHLKAMRFYGFDSFQGLPAIRGVDAAGPCEYHEGQFAYNVAELRGRLAREGVDLARVQFIQGWYDQTLNAETKRRLPIRKAAVIWVDCDLYESTVPVLDFITDYVQDGTILCFDDWFCFKGNPQRGEQRAFTEWRARNPRIRAYEYQKFEAAGNSFILNVAPAS